MRRVYLQCVHDMDECRDVWAEDTGEPVLEIDLGECENVYPSASARNYGIEIRVDNNDFFH